MSPQPPNPGGLAGTLLGGGAPGQAAPPGAPGGPPPNVTVPRKRVPLPAPRQLVLPKAEMNRLSNRVNEDYLHALSDHQRRIDRFRRYYQKWRNRVDLPQMGEEEASNFSVPLTQWQVFGKWSRDIASLLGEDAEIIAKPTGPSDEANVVKVGRFMTWRMFESMKVTNPLCEFIFRKILFGRSHAYAPYLRETYMVREARGDREEVDYEGPGFEPLWPDDFIVPAEDARTLHDFSFVIHRYLHTPDELLRGEAQGRYQGIRANFRDIVSFAKQRRERDFMGDQIKKEKDTSEGIQYEGGLSAGEAIRVHAWYGRWRMLKGKADAAYDNFDRRNTMESELVVRFIPEMNLIVGVQDLMDIYPRMKNRRPFVESSLVKDGSYWCQGYGELCESAEDELTANHNLFTEAGEKGVAPTVFFKPGAGFTEEKFRLEPGTGYPSEDPSGIKIVEMHADLAYCLQKEQAVIGFQERVTGVTDQNLGRASDRPNAPRTARQTIALLEEGNVRSSLDLTVLREDMGIIAQHIWLLDSQMSPEEVFFKVTDEDANGLFDVSRGGALMTSQDRGGGFNFGIKFATSVWSREAEKERQMQLYQVDMMNPLIQQDPRALWQITSRLHRAFGDSQFAALVPEPPDQGQGMNPKEEWGEILDGEDVHVHPMDNDDLHLMDHMKRLMQAREDQQLDARTDRLMQAHIIEHQQQKRQKMLMQAMTQMLVKGMAQAAESGAGLHNSPGVPLSLQQLHEHIGHMVAQPGAGPGGPAAQTPPARPNGAPRQ